MKRRVILHLGINKTGSSALQVAFVRNRELLARHGVHYPAWATDARASSGGVVSGNGQQLLPLLAPRPQDGAKRADRALAQVIEEVDRSAAPTVLYSSEILFRFRPDRVRRLVKELAAQDVQVQCVVYVRDIAGHALSVYAQGVKRNRVVRDLTEYLGADDTDGRYAPRLRERLEFLQDLLGPENLTVLHYDSERRDLVRRFATSVLGVPEDEELDLTMGEVNRSLSPHEIELMRYANRGIRHKQSAWALSDALIAEPAPDSDKKLVLVSAEMERLHALFDDEVTWLNETFFPDGRLTVEGGASVSPDAREAVTTTTSERHLVDTMVRLVGRKTPRGPKQGGSAPRSPATDPGGHGASRSLARRAADRVRRAAVVLVRGYY